MKTVQIIVASVMVRACDGATVTLQVRSFRNHIVVYMYMYSTCTNFIKSVGAHRCSYR